MASNTYTTVLSSGILSKRPSTVARRQLYTMIVAAMMRSAGSPCIMSVPEWAAISGVMDNNFILGADNTSSNHSNTDFESSIRPFCTSMAISHKDIAETPIILSSAIASTILCGIFSYCKFSHKRMWVSKTINISFHLHPGHSPILHGRGL